VAQAPSPVIPSKLEMFSFYGFIYNFIPLIHCNNKRDLPLRVNVQAKACTYKKEIAALRSQ